MKNKAKSFRAHPDDVMNGRKWWQELVCVCVTLAKEMEQKDEVTNTKRTENEIYERKKHTPRHKNMKRGDDLHIEGFAAC